MAEPMPMARRARLKAKIDDVAEKLRRKLGAEGIAVVAVFADGSERIHMLTGGAGTAPADVFGMVSRAQAMQAEIGEGWVQ